MSYASATSSLNERVRFPNFWRTYPSEDNIVLPILAILMQYGWNQLKIITQDETLFTLVSEKFTEFHCEWTMVTITKSILMGEATCAQYPVTLTW